VSVLPVIDLARFQLKVQPYWEFPLLETVATQSLEQTPNMVGLSIENEQGQLLVKRSRNQPVAEGKIRNYSHALNFEGEHFGTIKIQWDIEPVEEKIYQHVNDVQLFISTMLILLTGLTVILFYWLTVRPVHRITTYLNSLSENRQQSHLHLPTSASSELALLSKSANELSDMMLQRDKRELELLSTREELLIAHDEALSANRAKSGFLATMSHEIRTPMNAILGILGLLRDTTLNKHQKQLVQTGRDSGELLLTIINDILDFSKMEADKFQLECSAFDLHRMLSQSVKLLKHQADRKGLALILILEPDLPRYAKGDPDRLRQILINLINNAIKFTPEGSITVKTSHSTSHDDNFIFHCTVQDTGVGIAKELHSSIFQEFTMVDQTYSRNYEGTGLGLAICKRLASLMQGDIECSSELLKGSTFTFNIQLEHTDENKLDTREIFDGSHKMPASNTRILLAEDNPANQMVIKYILEYADLQVDIVANGHEAVEAVRSIPYDIVLMDISMPEMDGLAATRAIRQLSGQFGKVPIIALTAHALSGDKERFLKAGMTDYLSKPIDRNVALSCIARWTGINSVQQPGNETQVTATDIGHADAEDHYIDEQVMQQLVRDIAPDIVPELLTLYIEDAQYRTIQIQQAIKHNDFKALEYETHTLGSSAAAHGNGKLHKLARRIENLCQLGNQQQALIQASSLLEVADESFRLLMQRVNKGFLSVKQENDL